MPKRTLPSLATALLLTLAGTAGAADRSAATDASTPVAAATPPARPQPLYRYSAPTGGTLYTNRPPPPGVQARTLPYAPSPPQRPLPPVMPQPPTVAPAGGLPAPQSPQRSQQQVLLEQLARQIESLQTARNALKEGEAVRNGDERNYQRYLDRVQGLRDSVTRQEGVVEALQDQLRLLGSASLGE